MEFKLLRQEDGYSYYENPDKKMVAAIKAISKPNYIDNYHQGKMTFVKVQKNGNYLLEDENGDVESMSKEDYEEAINKTHEKIINKQFDICKLMNDNFMPIQESYCLIHEVVKPLEGFLAGDTYARISRFNQHMYCIEYQPATSYSLLHLSLTIHGEIKNRDYNHNFNKRLKIKTPDFYIKEMLKDIKIDEIESIEQQDKHFFIKAKNGQYCYTLQKYNSDNTYYFELEKRNYVNGNNYYQRGESNRKVVKGKHSVILSPKEFEKLILKEYNEYFNQEQIKIWDNQ